MIIRIQFVQMLKEMSVCMARPSLNSDGIPVRHRLELAFWELIKEHPIDEITVNMIVSRAGCARGSFYYHFDDIECLIDKIIERNVPSEVPQALYNWFFPVFRI